MMWYKPPSQHYMAKNKLSVVASDEERQKKTNKQKKHPVARNKFPDMFIISSFEGREQSQKTGTGIENHFQLRTGSKSV